jgi:glycerol-3-phosphate dehydrogenase (NAD(P)+)
LGDLTATCFSKLSRNRGFGERLGKGAKVSEVLSGMVTVAEGYPTARSARQLAQRHGAITPVIDEVYRTLYEGKDAKQGVRDLMGRDSKAED